MRAITSLKERLLDDMKSAMKKKEKARLSVIRMARAAIKNVEIDKRKDLNDSEVIEVLAKEVKQRRDSIEEFQRVGKTDTVQELEVEISVLAEYLPEQMGRDEIVKLVEQVINDIKATTMADMGEVMGAIMPKVKGRADGRLVNSIVQEKLN